MAPTVLPRIKSGSLYRWPGGVPDGAVVSNLPSSAGDTRDTVSGSTLGWEDSPGEGYGNRLQYSCPTLENPMDRGETARYTLSTRVATYISSEGFGEVPKDLSS